MGETYLAQTVGCTGNGGDHDWIRMSNGKCLVCHLRDRVAELEDLRDRVFDLVTEANMVRTPPHETATLLGAARHALYEDHDAQERRTDSDQSHRGAK